MIDNKGQVSLEYLLIFAISLIILIAFTLPMLDISLGNNFDVYNSIEAKDEVSKVANNINRVYGEGQGSRQTVTVYLNNPLTLDITKNHVTAKLRLNDGGYKTVKVNCKSNIDSTSINLNEGKNTIVVEWPEDSGKILIKKQI